MKTLFKLSLFGMFGASAVGCGLVEDLSTACGSDIEIICHAIFGENATEIDNLQNRVDVIEEKLEQLDDFIEVIETNLDLTESQVVQLQDVANMLQQQVVVLEQQDAVVEYIDPCGDGPGYDEILMKTSQGNLIAYFEDGGRRFLSLLEPGNYRTTDRQRCNFTVDNNLNVID